MRLLTHNMLRNNSAAAEGKGFPLKITATEIRVDEDAANDDDDDDRKVALVKGVLDTLDWPALVQVCECSGDTEFVRVMNSCMILSLVPSHSHCCFS
jgi:hypothetical protein